MYVAVRCMVHACCVTIEQETMASSSAEKKQRRVQSVWPLSAVEVHSSLSDSRVLRHSRSVLSHAALTIVQPSEVRSHAIAASVWPRSTLEHWYRGGESAASKSDSVIVLRRALGGSLKEASKHQPVGLARACTPSA